MKSRLVPCRNVQHPGKEGATGIQREPPWRDTLYGFLTPGCGSILQLRGFAIRFGKIQIMQNHAAAVVTPKPGAAEVLVNRLPLA